MNTTPEELARRLYWIEAAYRMGRKTAEQVFNESAPLMEQIMRDHTDEQQQWISTRVNDLLDANLTAQRNRPAQLQGIADSLRWMNVGVHHGHCTADDYDALEHQLLDPLNASERAKVLTMLPTGENT